MQQVRRLKQARLLEDFRPCFTAPTFLTFVLLAAGLVARPFSAVVAA